MCDNIKAGWIYVNGFDKKTNTIYEFWGDLWHGNPTKFDENYIHPFNGKPMKVLYEETQLKIDRIKKAGYNLIDIWETEWLATKENNEIGTKNRPK